MIAISILILAGILTLSGTISARAAEPGPGNDIGPMGPGPMRDQETKEMELARGYRFRYGMDTPVTSIENTDDREGVSIDIESLRFRNSSSDMTVDLSDRDWEVDGTGTENGMDVSYSATCAWKENGEQTPHTSKVRANFRYMKNEERESIDYFLEVEDIPGEGELTAVMRSGSSGEERGCCWRRQPDDPVQNRFVFTDKAGKGISSLELNEKVLMGTGNGSMQRNASVTEDLENETISLSVRAEVPEDTRSLSISGTLSFLEGFDDFVSGATGDAAEFVRDHIYSFLFGAALIMAVSIGAIAALSRKRMDRGGDDLDLRKNRYYKGD